MSMGSVADLVLRAVVGGVALLGAGLSVASEPVMVGAFSQGDLSGWETEAFQGETQYELVDTANGQVLKATASSSASGLFKKIKINLNETPCLQWQWKVDRALLGLKEDTKGGDDYAARVYVVVSTGPLFWQTHALSYVWSGARNIDDVWPNAYTDKATMIAVQRGNDRAGQWVGQSRNVLKDVRRFIDPDVTTIDGVAVMSDTDDSAQVATAHYGDMVFTSQCP